MHWLDRAVIHGRIDADDTADASLSHEYIDAWCEGLVSTAICIRLTLCHLHQKNVDYWASDSSQVASLPAERLRHALDGVEDFVNDLVTDSPHFARARSAPTPSGNLGSGWSSKKRPIEDLEVEGTNRLHRGEVNYMTLNKYSLLI
jgi:hypothetical protein